MNIETKIIESENPNHNQPLVHGPKPGTRIDEGGTLTNAFAKVLALGFFVIAGSACAATRTVTTLADNELGSLRATLLASAAGDTIDFAVTGTITLTNGELVIDRDLTILGPGASNLILSGNHASRVLRIDSGTVDLSGVTIARGLNTNIVAYGGGISNGGNLVLCNCRLYENAVTGFWETAGGGVYSYPGILTMSNCVLAGNSASGSSSGGLGGAICNGGALMIIDCLLEANSASGGWDLLNLVSGEGAGGAVYNSGTAAMSKCTLSGNSASIDNSEGGAGGSVWNGGTMSINNCTFAANIVRTGSTYPGHGGGLFNMGVVALTNCTFAANSAGLGGGVATGFGNSAMTLQSCTLSDNYAGAAPDTGGGLFVGSEGSASVRSTIIAGNVGGSSPDVEVLEAGRLRSDGFNLIGKVDGSSGWGANDLIGSTALPLDPMLAPLQDNGGPTLSMALLPGSPAVDAGFSGGIALDQRGHRRPVEDWTVPNAPGSDGSDIGAYERDVPLPPSITSQPLDQAVIAGQNAMFSVTAAGGLPLLYQWAFNSTWIAGATNSSFTVTNAQAPSSGGYRVVVTNPGGSVTSSAATLTVNYALTFSVVGGGLVAKDPNQASYAPYATVKLYAMPRVGWVFTGWSGSASGKDNPLSVMMDANKVIQANFNSAIPDIIIDNTNVAATFAGSWSTGDSKPGYFGADYWFTPASGDFNTVATFTPSLATPGRYDVYVWNPEVTAGRTLYTLSYAAGQLSLEEIPHAGSGGAWDLQFANSQFAAGTNGFLQIRSASPQSSQFIYADAVRWSWSVNQKLVPWIKDITKTGASVTVSWYSETGSVYRLQYKTDLGADSPWIDVGGDVTAANILASQTDSTAGSAPSRFYRVMVLP